MYSSLADVQLKGFVLQISLDGCHDPIGDFEQVDGVRGGTAAFGVAVALEIGARLIRRADDQRGAAAAASDKPTQRVFVGRFHAAFCLLVVELLDLRNPLLCSFEVLL